jgi:hypothetical protein
LAPIGAATMSPLYIEEGAPDRGEAELRARRPVTFAMIALRDRLMAIAVANLLAPVIGRGLSGD